MFKVEINNLVFSVTTSELKKLRAKGVKVSFVL